jgi:tRNA (uracil-5-)-methyltransferase
MKFTNILKPIIPPDSPPLEVAAAPKIAGFRNKVELTVGFDLSGELQVGFNLGSKMEDVIVPVSDVILIHPLVPVIAEHFRSFVLSSGQPAFDRISNSGVWKFILIRTTELEQSMLVVCVFGTLPQDTAAALHKAFADMVTSLFYVETNSFEGWGDNRVIHHLHGPEVIIEQLLGLSYEISPMSFFQTNTLGAEVLFARVAECAAVDDETVLIDCCCGTGVIALSMADRAKEVIGIDIEEEAIINARRNAQINGITNATFITGKAEVDLAPVLVERAAAGGKIVCVVDPPRGGLHKRALKAIRDCELIHRLIYISCEPTSLVREAETILMSTDTTTTEPFHPTACFGVDMFPHTDRLEVVMVMERPGQCP